MNKLLVAVFHDEAAVDAGLAALRRLHAAGDITLYATGVITRKADGSVSVNKPMEASPVGTATGLAVGSLIGLLGGPVGVVAGAATGAVAGAVHDFWVAGVGLDFIDEAARHLAPGKAALVAEVEEEWVIPVDNALEAVGGQLFRRSRNALAEAQFDHDIATAQSEIHELESEAADAGGAAKERLQAKLQAAESRLEAAMALARQRVRAMQQEADVKVDSLKLQLSQAKGDMRVRIEDRIQRVKSAYHARGAKLSQAWSLTKEALAL